MSSSESKALDDLLTRTRNSETILPDELLYLITAFLPSQPSELRSKAYLVLSAFCQGVRNRDSATPADSTQALKEMFGPLVSSRLSSDDESSVLSAISLLTALFQVDWESASAIFQLDDFAEFVMDTVDLSPSMELALAVAHLLSQASGHKVCRPTVLSHSLTWLQTYTRNNADDSLRAAAAIALVKLSKGTIADNAATTGPTTSEEQVDTSYDEDLASMMKDVVISHEGDSTSSITDAIEGLAYMSADPAVKESLSTDPSFLSHLFALVPRRKSTAEVNTSLVYGVLIIIANMCAYRTKLTEEQVQIEKLRTMAKAQSDTSSSAILDDDMHVRARITRLVNAGALDAIVSSIPGTSSSKGVRINAGTTLLHIIEDKDHRGKVLQTGGSKALQLIIRDAMNDITDGKKIDALDPVYLFPIQALAKLSITSPPIHVFGPDANALYNAIRPLSVMVQHTKSTLLQRFEGLMALTNLASASSNSPEAAGRAAEASSRIARAEGLMNKVEILMLEEHVLVRRAAVELVCNLVVGADEVFERYSGGDSEATADRNTSISIAQNKLHILLALSDVEDLPTRLAASGALATLTASSNACQILIEMQLERHRVFKIIAGLIDPNLVASDEDDEDEDKESQEYHPGLAHRGIICARNILTHLTSPSDSWDDASNDSLRLVCLEAATTGLMDALIGVANRLQSSTDAGDKNMVQPVGEALTVLVQGKPIDNEAGEEKK